MRYRVVKQGGHWICPRCLGQGGWWFKGYPLPYVEWEDCPDCDNGYLPRGKVRRGKKPERR